MSSNPSARRDFFISYTGSDDRWAEWVAWELESNGHSVLLQKWDFGAGNNFVVEMDAAIKQCERLVLILSHKSMTAPFVQAEWAAFFARNPDGRDHLIIPIRVDSCEPLGLLSSVVYIDLHDTTEDLARDRIEAGIGLTRHKPKLQPIFPGIKVSPFVKGPNFPLHVETQSLTSERREENADYRAMETGGVLPTISQRSIGRAFLFDGMQSLVAQYIDNHKALCVVILDVDGMGGINTKFGIGVGDAVLAKIVGMAEKLDRRLLVGRMGDDTIFVLLVDCDEEYALKQAKAFVAAVKRVDWNGLALGMFVTCSSGTAQFRRTEASTETLIRAVAGQREARRRGGNRALKGPSNLPHSVASYAADVRLNESHWLGS